MMSIKLKSRSELKGEHVHTTFWIGEDGHTLANIGNLVTNVGEAQILLAALLMGAEQTHGHLITEHIGYLSEHWAKERDEALKKGK